MIKKNKTLIKNTFYLYILTFAKLVLPIVTLPYLTRVLTKESYGVVTYVKACMAYMQLFIDFGFVLSATKEIKYSLNKKSFSLLGKVVGDTIAAKGLLSIIGAIILLIMSITIPILKENIVFTWLYFSSIVITIFLTDFLFRGLEKMEMVTLPFVISKTITTVFTFIFVKNDSMLINISILEIIGSLAAVIAVSVIMRKIGIVISFSNLKVWIDKIKDSFVYFISNFATTAFGALNTVVIGIFLNTADVAYWGLCMQIVGAIQNMYTPISNSIYPHMLTLKSKKFIHKTMVIFMPIVTAGCLFCLLLGGKIIVFVAGHQYEQAVPVFYTLIPVLFLGFPAIMYGWPTLGAIGKEKETSTSTVVASIVQVILLIILIITNSFTLINVALCRCISELILFGTRFFYYKKYSFLFND